MNNNIKLDSLTPLELQMIDDLWEHYMYNICDRNDADVDRCELEDIGYFREWLDSESFACIILLPQSDSTMQSLIKYCVKKTA